MSALLGAVGKAREAMEALAGATGAVCEALRADARQRARAGEISRLVLGLSRQLDRHLSAAQARCATCTSALSAAPTESLTPPAAHVGGGACSGSVQGTARSEEARGAREGGERDCGTQRQTNDAAVASVISPRQEQATTPDHQRQSPQQEQIGENVASTQTGLKITERAQRSSTQPSGNQKPKKTPKVHPHPHKTQTFSFTSIGIVSSIFPELNGCPRQGGLAPHAKATIFLDPRIDPKNALRGIDSFSHIWVVFAFHANVNTSYHPVVSPPKLGGKGIGGGRIHKLGTLATRSPHRPNCIGLTLAAIDSVNFDEGSLRLSGIDLVNGTPILDIKPYIPAADSAPQSSVRIPGWVAGGGSADFADFSRVEWTPNATLQLQTAAPHLRFYSGSEEAMSAITEVIRLDPRSAHMRSKHSMCVYGVCVDTLNVVYEVMEEPPPGAKWARVLEVQDLSTKHKCLEMKDSKHTDTSSTTASSEPVTTSFASLIHTTLPSPPQGS
ncbi:methyltransferase, YaeB/AF_0241 family protein [Pelomyxa schiedti]|nr:methyltransferase, YaeB/AF_0241 family protein [Pelomyxa schiedti]